MNVEWFTWFEESTIFCCISTVAVDTDKIMQEFFRVLRNTVGQFEGYSETSGEGWANYKRNDTEYCILTSKCNKVGCYNNYIYQRY